MKEQQPNNLPQKDALFAIYRKFPNEVAILRVQNRLYFYDRHRQLYQLIGEFPPFLLQNPRFIFR